MDNSELGRQYATLTQNIVSFVSTNVGSFGDWQNIPGNLSLVQSSTGGFVWGVKDRIIYYCQQPCTGTWKQVELATIKTKTGADISSIEALQVDTRMVYVLFTVGTAQYIGVHNIDGSGGSWMVLKNGTADKKPIMSDLGVTNQYIWVSGLDPVTTKPATFRCAKPCTTDAWVEVKDLGSTLSSMSSNGPKLYGMKFDATTAKNIAFSADETGGNMETISGLTGITPATINAQSADKKLLATTSTGEVIGCKAPCSQASDRVVIDTRGYKATSSKNPVTFANNQIWLAAGTQGTNGNLFQRLDDQNKDDIVKTIGDLDIKRTEIVTSLKNEYNSQTKEIKSNLQINDAMGAFESATNIDDKYGEAMSRADTLKSEIEKKNSVRETYSSKLYPIQILAFSLIATVVIYILMRPFTPTEFQKMFVGLALTVGIGAAIYFSLTNNTDGKSIVQRILPSP